MQLSIESELPAVSGTSHLCINEDFFRDHIIWQRYILKWNSTPLKTCSEINKTILNTLLITISMYSAQVWK